MIEEEGASLRCIIKEDDGKSVTQRMMPMPSRLGWFVNVVGRAVVLTDGKGWHG